MHKHLKNADGTYHIHGHKYKVLIGSRAQVWHGTAYKTEGASGMDLMALVKKPINLKPNSSCLVPTGLAVAFSSDFEHKMSTRTLLAV